MQRAIAIIVLVVFATGSALNLPCLFSCAQLRPAAASAESCHRSADSAPEISELGDCVVGLTQVPVLTAKRANARPTLLLATTVIDTSAPPRRHASSASQGLRIAAAVPPQPPHLIPLRI